MGDENVLYNYYLVSEMAGQQQQQQASGGLLNGILSSTILANIHSEPPW